VLVCFVPVPVPVPVPVLVGHVDILSPPARSLIPPWGINIEIDGAFPPARFEFNILGW
jgi:hypothetical protein